MPRVMPPKVGEVWTHDKFLLGRPGQERAHLVVLAVTKYSVTLRKLTSKATGRPQHPACCHGLPDGLYPAFYLGKGVLPVVPLDTWVDLLPRDDEDALDFSRDVAAGVLHCAGQLTIPLICEVLRCAELAPTTANYQRRQIFDSRTFLGCP